MLTKAMEDFIARHGWMMFGLVALLTLVQLAAIGGVAWAHASYPVVPIALTGDLVEVWGFALLCLLVVNGIFVWAVAKLLSAYAIRQAREDVASREAQVVREKDAIWLNMEFYSVHAWFVTNARGLANEGRDATAEKVRTLLSSHDAKIDVVNSRARR